MSKTGSTGSDRRGDSGIAPRLVSIPGEERKTSVTRSRAVRSPGQLDAGPFAADIASFRLHLAAENKAAGTIRIYTGAVRWFAASHLLAETDKTRWGQVGAADVRRWVVWLLGRYSEAYVYQQYRSLQQFFRWLAVEEDLPSPMSKLRPPKVTGKPVPFFSSVDLSKLGRCCRGNCSMTGGMRRSSRCSWQPASGCRSWPRSGCGDDPDHKTWTWRPAR